MNPREVYGLELRLWATAQVELEGEPTDYAVPWGAEIYGYVDTGDDDLEPVNMGSVTGRLMMLEDLIDTEAPYSVYTIFDSVDSEIESIYSALFTPDGDWKDSVGSPIRRNVFVISRISIQSEFRGIGLGETVLRRVLQLAGSWASIVVVIPSPYELVQKGVASEEPIFKKISRRLRGFYARNGFRSISGSDVMYKNLEYR